MAESISLERGGLGLKIYLSLVLARSKRGLHTLSSREQKKLIITM